MNPAKTLDNTLSKSLTGAYQQKNYVRKGGLSEVFIVCVLAVIGVLRQRGGAWNQPNHEKQLRTEVQKNVNRVVYIVLSIKWTLSGEHNELNVTGEHACSFRHGVLNIQKDVDQDVGCVPDKVEMAAP